VLLYATLGCGEAFTNGRHFSAFLGLTPKQINSGGKVNLIGIRRQVANRRLGTVLIRGARAYVYRLNEPETARDHKLRNTQIGRSSAGDHDLTEDIRPGR
jgi:transposase